MGKKKYKNKKIYRSNNIKVQTQTQPENNNVIKEVESSENLKKEATYAQQTFNFENNKLEDSEKKKTPSNLDNEITIEEIPLCLEESKTSKYPLKTVLSLVLIIFMLSTFIVYHFTTYDHNHNKEEDLTGETIVFLGDSITNGYKLDSHFKTYTKNYSVINSGINGNVTDDILNNLKHRVLQYNPSKVFLLIGTNDIGLGKDTDYITDNVEKIIEKIKKHDKKTQIYVESVYPVDEEKNTASGRNNDTIKELNKKVKTLCKKDNITYIDCYDSLLNDEGQLKDEYTYDGLHLTEKGYDVVTKKLEKYISL